MFKTLAVEGEVKPEPSTLALALAEVGLSSTEEQVVAAIQQNLEPAASYLSKAAFLRVVECLQSPGNETRDSQHSLHDEDANSERPALTLVGGEGNNSEGPVIEEASVGCDARATLDFEPRVSVDVLEGDARVLADKYYPRVKQAMVDDINQVVDMKLQAFMATLPPVAPGLAKRLQQGWLKDNYVMHVSEVVERAPKTTWSFSPAVSLDEFESREVVRVGG